MSAKAINVKAKSASKKTSEPSYMSFLGSIELIWIAMVETSFSGDRDEYFENEEHRRTLRWSCKPIDVGERYFELRSDFTLKLSPPKSGKCFFDLNVGYLLHLHGAGQFDKADVERFANFEARVVAWPYIREYVTSICGRMHVPPIVLPFGGEEE
jgi:hypothetical protein